MKWWEKTIEYKFIREFTNIDDFIAPLDGKEEKAADAIFAKENLWVLIEFKKDKSSINSEKTKFIDYNKAKTELSSKDKHHIIMYGELSSDRKNIALKAQTYFSENNIHLNKTLEFGIKTDEFKKYLENFLKHKKGSKVEGSMSGTGGYGVVAGVTSNGKVTKCLTLEEFSEGVKLSITIEKEHNQTIEQNNNFFRGL